VVTSLGGKAFGGEVVQHRLQLELVLGKAGEPSSVPMIPVRQHTRFHPILGLEIRVQNIRRLMRDSDRGAQEISTTEGKKILLLVSHIFGWEHNQPVLPDLVLPDSDPREAKARLARNLHAAFMKNPASHSLAVPYVKVNDVSLLLEYWRAALQEGVEVEDDDVHIVVPWDEVVVPQLAQQRAEHDTGTNLVLIRSLEKIVNVTNDQVPLVEKPDELELAEVTVHDVLS
jgi:hypothetical protein